MAWKLWVTTVPSTGMILPSESNLTLKSDMHIIASTNVLFHYHPKGHVDNPSLTHNGPRRMLCLIVTKGVI